MQGGISRYRLWGAALLAALMAFGIFSGALTTFYALFVARCELIVTANRYDYIIVYDDGAGYANNKIIVPVSTQFRGTWVDLAFPFAWKTTQSLRLDPDPSLNGAPLKIQRIAIRDFLGRDLIAWSGPELLKKLLPNSDIDSPVVAADQSLSFTGKNSDPFFILNANIQKELADGIRRPALGQFEAAFFSLYLPLGMAAIVFCAMVPVRGRSPLIWFSGILVGRSERFYRRAVILVALIYALQLAALPIVISYDGYDYLRLSDSIFTPGWIDTWTELRTPIFPLLLKLFAWFFGKGAVSVIALNSLFALGGILLLGQTVRRCYGEWAGAFTLLVLGCFPLLIAYSHSLLTEMGTFFFLSLMTWVCVCLRGKSVNGRYFAGLTLAFVLAYFFRLNLILLFPVVVVVELVQHYRQLKFAGLGRKLCWLGLFLVTIFIAKFTWEHLVCKPFQPGMVFKYIALSYAIADPSDPWTAPVREGYVAEIARTKNANQGRLPMEGIAEGWVMENIARVPLLSAWGFARMVAAHPDRYLLALYLKARHLLSVYPGENALFGRGVFDSGKSQLFYSPDNLNYNYAQTHYNLQTSSGAFSRIGNFLSRPYVVAVQLGFVALLVLGLAAVWSFNPLRVYLVAFPLFFWMLHWLTLMPCNRYIAPLYPFFLAGLVCFLISIWKGLMGDRTDTVMAEPPSTVAPIPKTNA